MLAEVEDRYTFVVGGEASRKVDVAAHVAVFCQELDIVLQVIGVAVELSFKDFECGTCIGKG